ncbi:MAG: sensor histidine kinase [Betaproteobacteria bacterium]
MLRIGFALVAGASAPTVQAATSGWATTSVSATGPMGPAALAALLGAAAALAGVGLAHRLRQNRELKQLRSHLAAAADWVWRCDADGRITDLAPLRTTAQGLDPARVLGSAVWQLLDPNAVCPTALRQAFDARQPAGPILIEHAGRVLGLAVVPVHGSGGFAGTAVELTHAAAGLREATGHAQLLERNRQLELTARELDSFAHSVSHDLRAPLRVVDGFASILLEDYAESRKPLDDQGRAHVRRIIAAGSRMNAMIDTLLSMSRMTAVELARERVDLTDLANELADDLTATDRSRRVRFVIAEQLVVDGDRTLLRLVLQNLMGNAFKFTGKTDPACIEVGIDSSRSPPVYFVRDNGVGFDMRFADKLFGVFQRFHSANEFPGTGVGLATVQQIVRKHGGRIWAESSPGAGATLYFTLWDKGSGSAPAPQQSAASS